MLYKRGIQAKIKKVFLFIVAMGVSCNAYAEMIIKKKLHTSIDKSQKIFILVKNDCYYERPQIGNEEAFVEMEIVSTLDSLGLNRSLNVSDANLIIECHFSHGWGLPRLVRHFKIKTKYITTVNIKIIDESKKEILGEVEYKRPWLKENPNEFIKIMFEKLFGNSA